MAYGDMALAVSGDPASSAEYNKVVGHVDDLDTRLDVTEALTTNTTTNGGTGNARLADRLGTGVGTGTNVTTGSASSQLADLRSRATTLESRTTNATSGNTALDGRVTSLESAAGGTKPVAWVVATAATTAAIDTWTKAALAGVRVDTVTGWSTANNRYTPNKAGWYRVVGQICGSASNSYTAAAIYKNGARTNDAGYSSAQGASAIFRTAQTEMMVNLNGTTDYIELWGFVGAVANFQHDDALGAASYISIEWVCPL